MGEEEDSFSLLEWRVDNFGCWNENFHDKMIASPKLKVSSAAFYCTLELYPRGLTGCDEHMGLRVCYNSGLQYPTSGEITFVGSDGDILSAQHLEDLALVERVLLLSPGPKFQEVVEKIRKNVAWYKDSLTLRLRIRNVCLPSVHRVRTKIKAIDTTYKIQRSTFAPSRYIPQGEVPSLLDFKPLHIADIPPFLTDESKVGMSLEAAPQKQPYGKVKLKFRVPGSSFPESYLNNFLVYTRLSVLDSDDVVLRSEDNEHVFVNEREWTFSQSLLSLSEMRNNEVFLLLRVKIIPSKRYEHDNVCEFDPRKVDVVPTFRTEHHFTSVYKESDQNEDSVKALSRQLSLLFKHPEFSDFQLKCENVIFPVHRNILAARSPVFRTMFYSNMREPASGVMDIEDLDAPTLTLFLAFLYTGALEELQGESAFKLYYAAEKYLVPSLKRECADFLSANVSNSNVCDVLLFADRHKDDQMTSSALDFILKKYNAVLISKEWDVFMEREPELAARVVTLMAERRGSGPYPRGGFVGV